MIGDEMTESERELWKKFFQINTSSKNCIEYLFSLKKEIEREVNIMNAPSKESVQSIANAEQSLRIMMIRLDICQQQLKRFNPNFRYN